MMEGAMDSGPNRKCICTHEFGKEIYHYADQLSDFANWLTVLVFLNLQSVPEESEPF